MVGNVVYIVHTYPAFRYVCKCSLGMQMANRVRITTAGVAERFWILTGTRTHQNWEVANFQKQDENFTE